MNARGFTLIEVLIVSSVTVLITGYLVANFSRSRSDLKQTVPVIVDAIRDAQLRALSGSLTQGAYRCGYGVHFDAASFFIYAGPDSATVDCASEVRNYEPGTDTLVRNVVLSNNALEIVVPTDDIFFEPPDPTTYINENSGPGVSTTITVRVKGDACTPGSADCQRITVFTSGRTEVQ